MTDTDPGRGSRGSRLLAPGDELRRWWSGLSRVQKWVFGVLGFGLLALTPLFPPPFFNTPGISFGGTMAQFAMVAIIAIGLNVVVGQAGLLDLGYVGFYAVGAYTVALLTSPDSPWNKMAPNGFLHEEWAWLACVPLAMAVTAMAGLILGTGLCFAQIHFKLVRIDPEVYLIDTLPMKLDPVNFVVVAAAALAMALLATWIPARLAANLDPVRVLRYD